MKAVDLNENKSVLDGANNLRTDFFHSAYQNSFPAVSRLITSNSGSVTDAEDVFQDTLLIILEKLRQNLLELTASFPTFLYIVAKYIWLQRLRDRMKTNPLYENFEQQEDTEQLDLARLDDELYNIYLDCFRQLTPKQKKVLNLYLGNASMKTISETMGYKSVDYAKFMKYLSKEQLKKIIYNDPRYNEVLIKYAS